MNDTCRTNYKTSRICFFYICVTLIMIVSSNVFAAGPNDQHQTSALQNTLYADATPAPDAEYNSAMRAARGRIQKYEEAVTSGNQDRIRKATRELQSDPLAVREINQTKSNAWKKSFKSEIRKIQTRTMQIAKRNIARIHGVNPEQVTIFEATNPPKIDPVTGEVIQKVGQDWDFTARIEGKDVKVNDVKQIVHDAYHEAATGERPPSSKGMSKVEYDRAVKGYHKRANQSAHRQALEVLNSTSDEAYAGAVSEGERVLSGPKDQKVRDPQQLSEVIEHKSNKAAETAEGFRKKGNTNRAVGADMEQFRQADKQIQKQVKPRVEARGGKMPEHLQKGADIIRKVAEGEISPNRGRAELAKMGETGETMIRKNAELFEASQKLESPREVLRRAKAGQTPPDVLTENVQNSLEIKRLKARANQPKSLADGGKSSFQGDTPPDNRPGSTLEQVRAKAEASLQSEKLRTGKSINRPKSMLDGGKASSSHLSKPPSKAARLDQAVGGKIQEAVGLGEISESSSSLRKGFTKQADKAMGAVAVAATIHEGYEAGHQYGEGLKAKGKGEEYRDRAIKAREEGNFAVADKLDKRAEEYEAEASEKMSKGLQDEAVLVGTLGVAATATGGAALAGYGAFKVGEASYGAAEGLSSKIVKEEYEREVAAAQKEGRAASGGTAGAKAGARIIGEVTGLRAGMEWMMGDSAKDRAHEEAERKYTDRRNAAISTLDEGLDKIAGIERGLRDLNKNPNQDDPWVRQRRQELLDQYDSVRTDLQSTNNRLERGAGNDAGASVTIRGAVALLPEKPDAGRSPEDSDELTTAMVTHQPTPAERAQWQAQGAVDPQSQAGQLVSGFSGTDAAGYTKAERKKKSWTRVTSKPEEIKKKDIEEEKKKKEEQVKQEEEKRVKQQRIDEGQFTNDWTNTIRSVNDSLSKLNEQDAEKVKNMTEAAIKLIQQMKDGSISDENFTRQMTELENKHAKLQQAGIDEWKKIGARLNGDMVNPGGGSGPVQINGSGQDKCAKNFTMNGSSEFLCGCNGYSFDYSSAKCANNGSSSEDAADKILGSVPKDQLDVRNVQCDTKSESGGDTPASITVGLGGSTGTANIKYNLYSVKDRIIVQYQGVSIYDTGCSSGINSIDVPISSPGGQLHVIVQPACAGKGTSWNFTVSCPGGAISGN